MLKHSFNFKGDNYTLIFHDTKDHSKFKKRKQSYGICFTKKGKVIIGKLPEQNWSLPGGTIEEGETPEEALIREVDEEVSISIKKFELIGVQEVFTNDKFTWSQLRFVCLIDEIKELTPDPDNNLLWERIILSPEEVFPTYIDWPLIGPHIMKKAIEIFSRWKRE